MDCHHKYGHALTWGVARTDKGPRCAVFCMRCRKALSRGLRPYQSKEFIDDYIREAIQ